MSSPYIYFLRPAYGSDELLIESFINSPIEEFIKDLFTTLERIQPEIESIEDLWMNDEIMFHVTSNQGKFLLSKDIWGYMFIMSEKNQPCIRLIDDILNKSSLFEKEEVDYEKYRSLKK